MHNLSGHLLEFIKHLIPLLTLPLPLQEAAWLWYIQVDAAEYPFNSIQYPVSSIQYPVSSIQISFQQILSLSLSLSGQAAILKVLRQWLKSSPAISFTALSSFKMWLTLKVGESNTKWSDKFLHLHFRAIQYPV